MICGFYSSYSSAENVKSFLMSQTQQSVLTQDQVQEEEQYRREYAFPYGPLPQPQEVFIPPYLRRAMLIKRAQKQDMNVQDPKPAPS